MNEQLGFEKIKKKAKEFNYAVCDLMEKDGIDKLHPKDQIFIHLKTAIASLSYAYCLVLLGADDRAEAEEVVRNLKRDLDSEVENIINNKLKQFDMDEEK